MIEVIGVRFKKAVKIFFFDPDVEKINDGESVIVETARGVEFGSVVIGNREVAEEEIVPPLKKVIRRATEVDFQQREINKEKETEAYGIALEKIKKHNLEMKLVDVELTFDLNKIIFYFTADGRIDFRELVKDLAYVFRMRIELRQVGVRDEAKFLNGIGICGRTLCCATFLDEFQPVSIKMAKEQSLSLNPTKISGICGRLMCCLKYEEETYEYLNRKIPNIGDMVKTPDGEGEVLSTSVLRQTARVAVRKKPTDSPTIGNYPVENIKVLKKKELKKDAENIELDVIENIEDLDKLKDIIEDHAPEVLNLPETILQESAKQRPKNPEKNNEQKPKEQVQRSREQRPRRQEQQKREQRPKDQEQQNREQKQKDQEQPVKDRKPKGQEQPVRARKPKDQEQPNREQRQKSRRIRPQRHRDKSSEPENERKDQ